ncbi:N-acetylmuramoyl-L-alanine amidase [Sutcliffiella horikoshii]|uniref:N-acetylmuramoyl-L-alanine amidase n=1 Tax=Sutcliffiella horikoshii TaxID=79883 RepID=UPI00384B7A6D
MTKIVVLDAGHGYSTPGKRTPDGMKEYEFNRVVAQYAKAELEKYEGVRTMFTHSDSRDVPLVERTNAANKADADVLVSIHANAFGNGGWNTVQGIETFSWDGHSPNGDRLASIIQAELIAATKRPNRGHKRANFRMVREFKRAAALVECGFMTNQAEAALLKADAYRKICAVAIATGVAKYLGLKRKPEPKPAPSKPAVNPNVFYRVVTGSFNDKENAEQRMAELKKAGFDSFLLAEEVKK